MLRSKARRRSCRHRACLDVSGRHHTRLKRSGGGVTTMADRRCVGGALLGLGVGALLAAPYYAPPPVVYAPPPAYYPAGLCLRAAAYAYAPAPYYRPYCR